MFAKLDVNSYWISRHLYFNICENNILITNGTVLIRILAHAVASDSLPLIPLQLKERSQILLPLPFAFFSCEIAHALLEWFWKQNSCHIEST